MAYLWIGLNQEPTSRGYSWSDGTATEYTFWGPGQPDDHRGEENCAAMRTESGQCNPVFFERKTRPNESSYPHQPDLNKRELTLGHEYKVRSL